MTRRKKPAPAAEEPGIVQAALAELEIAPENAQPRAEAHVARLAASIKAFGLKQNLVGYRGEDGKIYVTAGGSRLLALRKIRANGAVPVRLEPRESATATGLAENVIRADMATGARVRAWKRLHAEGLSAEQIMKTFSIEKRLYDRTMRLADLPDPILDGLDAGEMTLDHAAAFTAGLPDEALALYEQVKESGQGFVTTWGPGAPQGIRQSLTREKIRGDGVLATFVGREAYEKKGGVITEDLFHEDVWFEDGKLLHDLAQSKLAKAAKKLRAEWAWVEVSVADPGHEELRAFGRLRPTREESLTAEEKAELVTLSGKVEAEGDGALTEEEEARFDELDTRPPREIWSAEQRQVAGAIVTIGDEGELELIGGLVKPDDVERAVEAGVMEPDRHMPDPAAVRAQAKDDGAWKHAIVEDLMEIRRWALRSWLVQDQQEMLLRLLTADLAGTWVHAFDFRYRQMLDDRLLAQGLAVHPSLTCAPASDCPELPDILVMLGDECQELLYPALALRLTDPLDQVLAVLPPDVRAWWTPNEKFLKRLSKEQLLEIVREIGAGSGAIASWSQLKKGETAQALSRIFAGDLDGGYGNGPSLVQQEAIDAAKAWLPPCLRPAETAEAGPEREEEAVDG